MNGYRYGHVKKCGWMRRKTSKRILTEADWKMSTVMDVDKDADGSEC
jgi:hypothetical protein